MSKRVAIVCFRTRADRTSPGAVEPFLFNLFCDPGHYSSWTTGWAASSKPIARYISRTRAQHVREHYDAIGGQSPIRLLTERQARKLEATLAPAMDAKVFVAMRYWNPLTKEAVEGVLAEDFDSVVLLPLYPQYSFATTRSSLKEWERLYHPQNPAPEVHLIERFYDHPLYIEAVVDRIELALSHFPDPRKAHIVFSAHGLPLSLIEKGDPYQKQIEETVRLVMEDGRWQNGHTLCYQSKVGRQKWLQPALDPTIEDLARRGEKNLLIVPVSFVTEHIETPARDKY